MVHATRVCGWCFIDISARPPNVRYCSRTHKTQSGSRRHQVAAAGSSAAYWRDYRAARRVEKPARSAPTEKRCSKCKRIQPIDAFYWIASRKAPSSRCRACRCEENKTATRARRGLPPEAVLTCANLDTKPDGWSYVHQGYVMVKKAGHPRASKDGYVYEHILVAETKYGIEITAGFSIHHLNADRADNRPANLELRLAPTHGKGGDVMHTLLRRPELRAQAAAALAGYGWTVLPPGRDESPTLPFAS